METFCYILQTRGIAISYVSGYAVRHSMGLVRGKSDPLDCSRIREYAERNPDKLEITHFPSETLYKLRELHATRRLLVDMRKILITTQAGDKKRPIHSEVAEQAKMETLESLSYQISKVEKEMLQLIESLQLPRPLCLAGHSMGGKTVMRLLLHERGLAARAAVIDKSQHSKYTCAERGGARDTPRFHSGKWQPVFLGRLFANRVAACGRHERRRDYGGCIPCR